MVRSCHTNEVLWPAGWMVQRVTDLVNSRRNDTGVQEKLGYGNRVRCLTLCTVFLGPSFESTIVHLSHTAPPSQLSNPIPRHHQFQHPPSRNMCALKFKEEHAPPLPCHKQRNPTFSGAKVPTLNPTCHLIPHTHHTYEFPKELYRTGSLAQAPPCVIHAWLQSGS